MACECLNTVSTSNVPELRQKVQSKIRERVKVTFAEASQAPETNVFWSGERESDITSPVWPAKVVTCCPVSMSHRTLKKIKLFLLRKSTGMMTYQDMSPLEVRI